MSLCEYHPKPSPHFVMDDEVLQKVKDGTAAQGAEWRPDTSIAGQTGIWSGCPVYLDECPWDCPRPVRSAQEPVEAQEGREP